MVNHSAILHRNFTSKHLLLLLSFYALFALIFAYVSQFVFDHQPCILCLYQRVPFFAVVVVTALSILFLKKERLKKIALFLCLAMLLINVGMASYHVGVEKKIFKGPVTCSRGLEKITDLDELRAAIMKTKAIRCDRPSFVFLGLSMAAWNVVYCLFLVGLTLVILPKNAPEYLELKPSLHQKKRR